MRTFADPLLMGQRRAYLPTITDKIIKDLQDFQDKFIRKVLQLPTSTTKAIYQWDSGMLSMKWRIALKKLLFVNKIMPYACNYAIK